MIKAKGPVWHKKHKQQNIIPKGLRGIDKEATWCTSKADGWIYGHGSFSIVSHKIPVLGCFLWMPNSGHEAKRMYSEMNHYQDCLKYIVMDSKADDQKLLSVLKDNYKMNLVTVCRKHMNKTESRQAMIKRMQSPRRRKYLKERSHTVEPMQGIVKDIFELERCWMRGDENNRWLFAAMGIAVQMAQLKAVKEQKSTWKIKAEVLGEP